MSAKNDSTQKTILVAVLLCLVCSIFVAGAAVSLKPMQVKNKLEDKKKNILAAAGLLVADKTIAEQFEQIETRIVNLQSGDYASEVELTELAAAGFPLATFDQRKLSKNSTFSAALSSKEDIASIKRLEKFAAVFLVQKDGKIDRIILPVHGYGLWSTLYGFVALESNADTIAGMGFYSHGETPGLGGEVDNVNWKASWVGKKIQDESGALAISVVKGKVDMNSASAVNQVDGLSGATLTGQGVSNLMQFWLGEQGFSAYLTKMKGQGI